MENREYFISDLIDFTKADKTKFNIIASGCGTGKTFFVANKVREYLPWVKSSEILFVVSRAMIVDQQSKQSGITKYNPNNITNIKHWNGEEDSLELLKSKDIQIMTYDKIIDILLEGNSEGYETLSKIKIIFFDECHAMFSDTFIEDMEALKVWIRDTLNKGKKYITGMTATPRIIYYNNNWGVSLNQINKEIIMKYKAKQLYCTNFNTLHFLLANKEIQGKTMVMCYSIEDCYKLKKKIPNSFVLVSKSNSKEYIPEVMEEVRQYIVDNESLPDTYLEIIDVDSNKKIITERRKLEVLITTSTLREGVNLREDSNVKNIAITFTDELHISQWVGRCRYDVDNLIIAESYIRSDNFTKNKRKSYIFQSREQYKDFMKDINHTKWFDSIAHLLDHDITKIRRFVLSNSEQMFTTYINQKWLVPSGLSDNELNKYKIYRQEDKDEIVNKVLHYQLIDDSPSRINFNRVMRFMEDTLGYTIENGRLQYKNKRYTYKLIVDFDDDEYAENTKKDKEGND